MGRIYKKMASMMDRLRTYVGVAATFRYMYICIAASYRSWDAVSITTHACMV